ncbi:Acyl-CoA N-acyltransferases (Nat) [Venturia nashicola]|nr:Acyl-CoA N-acyltransferases (Nat) [Venturia nashicola]
MENLFRSERLVYRAVEESDESFFHRIQSDVSAYANSDSGILKPMTKKESQSHMEYVANKTLLGVIICLPPSEESGPIPTPIGSIYLTAPKSGEEHHRNAYISVDIIKEYQRKGYGGEAIHWATDWGFKIAGLHRVGIEHYSYNEGAERLYTRLGFTLEGRKRELLWHNGGWHDYLSYSILESEWAGIKARG